MDQDHNHMQSPQDRPPPSYSAGLQLAPVGNGESSQQGQTLPSLADAVPSSWPSANPLSVYHQPDSTTYAAMDVETPASPDGRVLSIDDPDVRLAAEALGDLRADFVSSPPPRSSPRTSSQRRRRRDPEPLLSLLLTTHPFIGTAIGGSISAYSASKNYSPRFKSSAEYVERRFTPVVNTLGTVGRVTGVEGGVRWFLGGRRRPGRKSQNMISAAAMERENSNKRRKINENRMDVDAGHQQELVHRERRSSQSSSVAESLPAYDDYRSPSYEEALTTTRDEETSEDPTWQSKLIMSTSGLSIAMSEESLRSLKYCLGWLRWANEHIGKVIDALKTALEEYERALLTNGESSEGQLITKSEAHRTALVARIGELKGDVMKTVKDAVEVVSKYAGGALPENARALVRHHLTSLPQRFRLANTPRASSTKDDLRDSAQRVMVLAKECLDMMGQVSGVLDGTIVSAEEWCERLGRKKAEEDASDAEARREKQAVGEALAAVQ